MGVSFIFKEKKKDNYEFLKFDKKKGLMQTAPFYNSLLSNNQSYKTIILKIPNIVVVASDSSEFKYYFL